MRGRGEAAPRSQPSERGIPRTHLLDDIQSQRGRLGEHLEADAVDRVLQDQAADVKPPRKAEQGHKVGPSKRLNKRGRLSEGSVLVGKELGDEVLHRNHRLVLVDGADSA